MSASATISAAEYLKTSYKPDMELVNGELKEKPMPSRLHGYVQALICAWFFNHKAEWKTAAESEVRTKVRSENFRLPDVSITRLGSLSGKIQQNPPLIAIEILSEDDRFAELERRASDLEKMGVGHIWLIDPESYRAWVWSGQNSWTLTQKLRAGNEIHLDLPWLWAEVSEHQSVNHEG